MAGLLALMLLTDARRPARTGARRRADPARRAGPRAAGTGTSIARGRRADHRTRWPTGAVGPYQLQAAIAAVHDEAARAEDTDWPQILALYELLEPLAPNPMVTLNRAVAVAMVHGPRPDSICSDAGRRRPAAGHHRLDAVRAHLLEMAGDHDAARSAYRTAARRTTSLPEQRYLESRAARLAAEGP